MTMLLLVMSSDEPDVIVNDDSVLNPLPLTSRSAAGTPLCPMSGRRNAAGTDRSACPARLKRNWRVSPGGDTCGDTPHFLNVDGRGRVVLKEGSNFGQQTR